MPLMKPEANTWRVRQVVHMQKSEEKGGSLCGLKGGYPDGEQESTADADAVFMRTLSYHLARAAVH
jgi:hypothetical protein